MAGSLSNSWALVKASVQVLRLDKELMVFPMLSGVASLLVVASFVVPFALTGAWRVFGEGGEGSYLAYVLGFSFYLVQYTVIFFFNSALVGAALIRMDGGDPTVSDGLGIAFSRLGTILGYAALSATVGMVLRFVSERSGFLGRIVAGLVGVAWTLATYLAVPVLVTQDLGPVESVKESARLFRRTWGEQVVGNFGLGWAVALMGLSWTAVSVGMVLLGARISPVALGFGLAAALTGYVFLALFSSAMKGIYTAALYRYASTGEAGLFDSTMVGGAFRPRR